MTHCSNFAVIGGGWRAQFYLRVASLLPDLFRVVGVVADRRDHVAHVEASWHVPVFRSLTALFDDVTPDFVVTSVRPDVNVSVVSELMRTGIPVLSETPPAPDLPQMEELCALENRSHAIVEVAEQNPQIPIYAAAHEVIQRSYLGEITSVATSATVGYHSIALIRNLLGVDQEPPEINAIKVPTSIVPGPGRSGWPNSDAATLVPHIVATLRFPGDKLGIYDWTLGQSFHPILPHRLLVRGERGELSMRRLTYLSEPRTAATLQLERKQTGRGADLGGLHLQSIFLGENEVYRNPFAPARLSDEEIAVASCLAGIVRRVQGAAGNYTLASACQDNYLALQIEESAKQGHALRATTRPWS